MFNNLLIYRGFVISVQPIHPENITGDTNLRLCRGDTFVVHLPINVRHDYTLSVSTLIEYVDILLDELPNVTGGEPYPIDSTYFGYQNDDQAYAQDGANGQTVIICCPTLKLKEHRLYVNNEKVFIADICLVNNRVLCYRIED